MEARVDEAVYALASQVERAEGLIDKLDRETTSPTDAEVEQFRNAIVNGPNDTPEWRVVAERITRGDFEWRDVLEGHLHSEPDVNAAFMSVRGLAVGEDVAKVSDELSGSMPPGKNLQIDDDDYFDRSIFERRK